MMRRRGMSNILQKYIQIFILIPPTVVNNNCLPVCIGKRGTLSWPKNRALLIIQLLGEGKNPFFLTKMKNNQLVIERKRTKICDILFKNIEISSNCGMLSAR